MQIMNITITLTLAINLNNFMAPHKKVSCTALMNSDKYLADRIIQAMHIMHIVHSMHVMQIMYLTVSPTLALNFKYLMAPPRSAGGMAFMKSC